jgi:DNA polymerase V
MALFEQIMDKSLYSRRISIAACNLLHKDHVPEHMQYRQMSLFDLAAESAAGTGSENGTAAASDSSKPRAADPEKERALQEAMVEIKKKYGKNAVVKVKNLSAGGTAMERNNQIGGHKA